MMDFGQDGDIQIGCGIMVLDMEVLIHGGMVIITTGQDHFPIMAEFIIHSILFGDTMTPSTMVMDMVAITMDTILG